MNNFTHKEQILEGSRAIALTIKNIAPAVISAYPITPQTHIVEDLAKFKADAAPATPGLRGGRGQADYEYVRAESEFAAASIVAGASAAGVRTYSATSSQGLLLMAEVIFNIAGMRLPIVMTCANRSLSAPINIWNDQQDVMTIRDAGWILLFAENHQEAVNQHIMAFKLAERLKIPVMVNVDGFVMTHTYEPVTIPAVEQIKAYLPDYEPKAGEYLDPKNPVTMGALATPAHYMEIRQELHDDLVASLKTIDQEYKNFNKIIPSLKITSPGLVGLGPKNLKLKISDKNSIIVDNGLLEYTGPKSPQTVIVAMGSVVGTIKATLSLPRRGQGEVGVLKIKCLRPFPAKQVMAILKPAKNIAVIDKSISLGQIGVLASEIKAAGQGKIKAKINSFIVGLGGRDITNDIIRKIIKQAGKDLDGAKFVGK